MIRKMTHWTFLTGFQKTNSRQILTNRIFCFHPQRKPVKIEGLSKKQPSKKLLGVIIDNKPNFNEHVPEKI